MWKRKTRKVLSHAKKRGSLDKVKSNPYVIHILDKHYLPAYHFNVTRAKDTIYYDEMRTLYYWLALIAKWPHMKFETGYFKITAISWSYCIIYYIIFFGLNAISYAEVMSLVITNEMYEFTGQESHYDNALFLISIIHSIHWNFSIPIFDWPFAYRNVRFLNRWHHFQDMYNARTGRKLKIKYKCYINLMMATLAILNGCMLLFGLDAIFFRVKWYSKLCITIGTTDGALFLVFWWYTCLMISDIGKQLSNELIQELQGRNGNKTEQIHNYRMLWLELTKICNDYTSLLEYKFILYLLIIISVFTINVYQVAKWFFENNDKTPVRQYIVVIIYSLIILYLSTEGGERIYKEVGENLLEKIYKCNLLLLTNNERYEIESFLHILKNKPPKIIISDFLVVNRQLMTQILSGLITYIIILVQFKLSTN